MVFIIIAPLTTQASSPKLTIREIRELQITPLHKATTIEEVKEILKYGPDINAVDIAGRTPTDYLLARALQAKENRNNLCLDQYVTAAKYLISRGGKYKQIKTR